MPILCTSIVESKSNIRVLINQGKPRPNKMSNTLLPSACETAISPCPKKENTSY